MEASRGPCSNGARRQWSTFVRLAPERMQVWRGPAEFAGRTVMRHGVWLDRPID